MRMITYSSIVHVDGFPMNAVRFLRLDYTGVWKVKDGHEIHCSGKGAIMRPTDTTKEG
jgi:hypothetical protein